MANQLLLAQQKIMLSDILDQLPDSGKSKVKVFFQSELRSLANGDATFGVVAYPVWREDGEWIIGKKVTGKDAGPVTSKPFGTPISFANNEILLSAKKGKKPKRDGKGKDPRKGRWNELMKMVKKNIKDPVELKKCFFLFDQTISGNPHLEYNVMIDGISQTFSTQTKPSPPALPEAY